MFAHTSQIVQLTLCIPILLFVFFSGVTFKTLLFVCCGCEYITVEYSTPHISTLSSFFSFSLCSTTLPKDSDHQLSLEQFSTTFLWPVFYLFCVMAKKNPKPNLWGKKTPNQMKKTNKKIKAKRKQGLKLLTLSDKYVLSFQEMRLTSQY